MKYKNFYKGSFTGYYILDEELYCSGYSLRKDPRGGWNFYSTRKHLWWAHSLKSMDHWIEDYIFKFLVEPVK